MAELYNVINIFSGEFITVPGEHLEKVKCKRCDLFVRKARGPILQPHSGRKDYVLKCLNCGGEVVAVEILSKENIDE
jgi:hypothetical protein